MNTLYVNYTNNGTPIADCNVEERILQQASLCKNGQDKEWRVSTGNVILAVRAMKMSGKIGCDVVLMFDGTELEMNEYCVVTNWPNGFADYEMNWLSDLFKAQMKKRKGETNGE